MCSARYAGWHPTDRSSTCPAPASVGCSGSSPYMRRDSCAQSGSPTCSASQMERSGRRCRAFARRSDRPRCVPRAPGTHWRVMSMPPSFAQRWGTQARRPTNWRHWSKHSGCGPDLSSRSSSCRVRPRTGVPRGRPARDARFTGSNGGRSPRRRRGGRDPHRFAIRPSDHAIRACACRQRDVFGDRPGESCPQARTCRACPREG